MDHRPVIASALATLLALGALQDAQAHKAGASEEKCYGVAKAGQNDCADLAGLHMCAGESTVDNDPKEWKYVQKGSCKNLKGLSEVEAKAAEARKPAKG